MKKHTLLTYLLILCIGATILLPPPPAPQPDPNETIEPLNDEWNIDKF